jgi:LysR family nitrogen assimilation transcriptional regulator
MELRQLRYFKSILEHGSFGRAAEQLFIAQSALSMQIKKLEEELGCRLLVRSAQGVTLTPSGQKLLGHANLILSQVAQAVQEVRQVQPSDMRGNVRLGLMSTVGRMLTIPLLEEIEIHFPNLALHVIEALTGDLERMVRSGEIDLAVTFQPSTASPALHSRVLREERLYLVSPANAAVPRADPRSDQRADPESRPIPFSELGAFDLILPSMRFTLRKLAEQEARLHGISLRVKYELDSLSQSLALINRVGCHSIMLLSTFHAEWLQGNVCAREISSMMMRPQTLLISNAGHANSAASAVGELVTRAVDQLNLNRQWPLTLQKAPAAA